MQPNGTAIPQRTVHGSRSQRKLVRANASNRADGIFVIGAPRKLVHAMWKRKGIRRDHRRTAAIRKQTAFPSRLRLAILYHPDARPSPPHSARSTHIDVEVEPRSRTEILRKNPSFPR